MIKCKTSKEIGGMGHSIRRKEDQENFSPGYEEDLEKQETNSHQDGKKTLPKKKVKEVTPVNGSEEDKQQIPHGRSNAEKIAILES